ncbi:MAG: prolyl oligopeptidase family serine peptidase [Myxococcota bacterium]
MSLRRDVKPGDPVAEDADIATKQAALPTQLIGFGPSPQPYDEEPLPRGTQEVTYVSEGRKLRGWLRPGTEGGPAFVWLHGGFATGADAVDRCPQFPAAGYTVFAPTYRGENGNPGDFELMFGEVRDAAAAVRYVASLPNVDPDRVYVLGHSIGGGTSALLATLPDVPAALTGSIGGMYTETSAQGFAADFWPDAVVPQHEWALRASVAQVGAMRRPHHAFVGRDDEAILANFREAWIRTRGAVDHPMKTHVVTGDHGGSIEPACKAFFDFAEGKVPNNVSTSDPASLLPGIRDASIPLSIDEPAWGRPPLGERGADVDTGDWKTHTFAGFELSYPPGATLTTSSDESVSTVTLSVGSEVVALSTVDVPPAAEGFFMRYFLSTLLTSPDVVSGLQWFSTDAGPKTGIQVRGRSRQGEEFMRAQVRGTTLVILEANSPEPPVIQAIVASVVPAK